MGNPRFELLDHIADLRVRVFGKDPNELFANAAYAMFSVMADLSNVVPVSKKDVEVSAEDLEGLLVQWLSDLLFLVATQQFIASQVNITEMNGTKLRAEVYGEELDLAKHEFHTEIKAVTYHQLKIEKVNDHWIAEIIFDI